MVPRRTTAALVLAIASVVMLVSVDGVAYATTFNPLFLAPVSFSDSTPGGHPDIGISFNIPPPHALGGAVNFSDPALTTATDAQVPNGAYVGQVSSVAQLGLFNDGCMTSVQATFDLVDASTDFTLARPMGVHAGGVSDITLAAAVTNSTDVVPYAGPDLLGTKAGATEGTPGNANHPDAAVNEIRIDSEDMLVTGVDELGNNFIVLRGWNGTAPAAHNTVGTGINRVNVIFPNGSLGNVAEDDGDLDNNGAAEHPELANGIADGADEVPSFFQNSLDPDGNPVNGGAVAPIARYFGVDIVFNLSIIPLQVAIFAPGALAAFPNQSWMTSAWGTPSLIVLGDPLSPPSNTGITDFCNLTSNSTVLGITHDNACTPALGAPPGCSQTGAGFTIRKGVDGGCPGSTTPNECGFIRATNPATTKTLKTRVYAVSERDYDNDGIGNSLDVCYAQPNGGWDPRASNSLSGGDSDADGLPDACDPNPFVPNPDQDGDGWPNRIDDCPNNANSQGAAHGGGTVPNTYQFDLDVPYGVAVPDGGPRSDSIGAGSSNPGDSGCDNAANSCDVACGFPAGTNQLTPTGANGHYHAVLIVDNVCIGLAGSDSDGDGVCNVDEPPASKCAGGVNDNDCDNDGVTDRFDNCIAGPNTPAPFVTAGGSGTLTQAAAAGDNSVTVGNTFGFYVGNQIIIGAGATRETLRYITNVPDNTHIEFADQPGNDQSLVYGHAVGETVAMVAFAQAQRDLNGDGFSDGTDITILAGSFGKLGGDPARPAGYQGRFDLNNTGNGPDSVNDGTDLTILAGAFGKPC